MNGKIASPCVSICKMDPTNGLCLGCWRTLNEIAAWSALDDARRAEVMAELPGRRRQSRAARRSAANPG
jgi:uncharacterized protein